MELNVLEKEFLAAIDWRLTVCRFLWSFHFHVFPRLPTFIALLLVPKLLLPTCLVLPFVNVSAPANCFKNTTSI